MKILDEWSKAKLSSREGAIWQLKHQDELTFEEVSEILGISLSSVKTHFYRAQKKFEEFQAS